MEHNPSNQANKKLNDTAKPGQQCIHCSMSMHLFITYAKPYMADATAF